MPVTTFKMNKLHCGVAESLYIRIVAFDMEDASVKKCFLQVFHIQGMIFASSFLTLCHGYFAYL
uniref:Uncharacterized protein n=1 Tax=Setaria italica TaxID=4555 RepID=K3ZBL6_SETIT